MDQVLRAFITSTGAGTVTLATPPNSNSRIRVISAILNGASTASTIELLDDATAISPTFNVGIDAINVLQPNSNGWFTTSIGNDLKVDFGASGLSIAITYITTYE